MKHLDGLRKRLERRLGGEPIAERFHRDYYEGAGRAQPVWKETYWRGYQVKKCPFDLWLYQEIIHEQRPEVIVETGVFNGGSIAYLASLCDLFQRGDVIGVDIDLRAVARELEGHPRVTLIEGSSTDPAVVQRVRDLVAGRSALVILDSDHRRDHVLRELRWYAELIPVGGTLIVEDTNVNGHPVYEDFGPGPFEAVQAFLREDRRFEIDREREKFPLSFNPSGYLRRVKA